ncbi:hypothetical protein ACRRTK_016623 [Alexandromys fortis]
MNPFLTSVSNSNNGSIICGFENLENTNYPGSRIPASIHCSFSHCSVPFSQIVKVGVTHTTHSSHSFFEMKIIKWLTPGSSACFSKQKS